MKFPTKPESNKALTSAITFYTHKKFERPKNSFPACSKRAPPSPPKPRFSVAATSIFNVILPGFHLTQFVTNNFVWCHPMDFYTQDGVMAQLSIILHYSPKVLPRLIDCNHKESFKLPIGAKTEVFKASFIPLLPYFSDHHTRNISSYWDCLDAFKNHKLSLRIMV